ncbi:MAG: APC family permease [Acidimicrobiales bacterium]
MFASVANGLQVLLASGGITVAWVWLAVCFWALTFVLAYRSISLSSRIILVPEAASVALVAVVAVATVAHGGWHGQRVSPAPFAPPASGVGTLGLGIVFAFTGFSGFEVAATLGEESSRAHRVIPAAVVVALLVSGGVYTAMSWVETIGFPNAAALAHSPLPLVFIALVFIGPPMGTLVNVAALVSGFGACLAATNGAVRLVFALARDGLGPRRLATTHPTHRSPVTALVVVSVLTLGSFLPLAGGKPLTAFTVLATYGADLIVVAYLLTCAAAVAFSLRRAGLGRRRRLAGIAIPLAGVGVLAWVLESSIWPLPAPPFDLLLYLTGAALAAGIAMVALRPGFRRRLAASPVFRVEAG